MFVLAGDSSASCDQQTLRTPVTRLGTAIQLACYNTNKLHVHPIHGMFRSASKRCLCSFAVPISHHFSSSHRLLFFIKCFFKCVSSDDVINKGFFFTPALNVSLGGPTVISRFNKRRSFRQLLFIYFICV